MQASCGVPGLPAGLDELWCAHGRLPWTRVVEPALRLAREGVDFPPAHAACLAMLAPVMTMDAGAAIYVAGMARRFDAGVEMAEAALAEGLFVPESACAELRRRLGDVLILPYLGNFIWWREKGVMGNNFYGHHGGLSREELITVVGAIDTL